MIPLAYPLIAAATVSNLSWFFPAFTVVIGAHFMPYAYIHQMRSYVVLGVTLVLGGTAIGYLRPGDFAAAGYFGGAVLVASAGIVLAIVRDGGRRAPATASHENH